MSPNPVQPRPLGRDLPTRQPSLDTIGRPDRVLAEPMDSLSLRDALALALLQSPQLATFSWEVRAQEARVLQASRRSNPLIEAWVEDVGATARGDAAGNLQSIQPQSTVQLSQVIELGGKRVQRRDLAARSRDLAAWDYEAARMDVLTGTTHAFIDVLTAQAQVALSERTSRLAEEVRQSVSARVAAGDASPVEETRAELALAAARVESTRSARALTASRQRLAASWGATAAGFAAAAGTLGIADTLPAMAELSARVSDNPDLARWAAELQMREAALRSERWKRVPDLTLRAGYRAFQGLGIETFILGGSFPIPLFDRNRGAIEEAKSRFAKSREGRRAAEALVAVRLAEAYGMLTGSHAEVRALRETVLPGSQRTFDAIAEGYRLGRFSYLEFLDAQRTLIGASTQYLQALAEYNKAAANVERLTGAPLQAVPPNAQ